MALIGWFNRFEQPLGNLDVISATHSESVDGEDLLDITCTDHAVTKGDRLVWLSQDGAWREHVVDTAVCTRESGYAVTRLRCINSMAYDLSMQIVQDDFVASLFRESTLESAVRNIVRQNPYLDYDSLRWGVGTVDSEEIDIDRDSNGCYISKASALGEVADLGFEVYPTVTVSNAFVSARYVNAVAQRGSPDTFWRFEYGVNAGSVTRTILGSEPVSRLYAFGKVKENYIPPRRLRLSDIKGKEDYIETTASLNNWGLTNADGTGKIPTEAVIVFEEAENYRELQKMANKAFMEMQNARVSYEVDALSVTNDDPEAVLAIGDSVHVVDSGITPEIRFEGRVTRIVRNVVTGEAKATVGAKVGNVSNRFASIIARSDSIDRRIAYLEGR